MEKLTSRCIICTASLLVVDCAVLLCGHTYHFDCIHKWLRSSATCPVCRVAAQPRHVVKKLFFESAAESSNAGEHCELQLAEQVTTLRREVTDLKEKYEKAAGSEVKLGQELVKAKQEARQLEKENRHYGRMLTDQDALIRDNERLSARLRATEFYQILLNTKGSEIEESLSQYITSENDLNYEKFLALLQRQLKESKKENHRFQLEIASYEKKMAESRRKEEEYKKLVQALREEAKQLRDQLEVGERTPANARLRPLLVGSLHRPPLGFDDSLDEQMLDFDEAILQTAVKRPKISKLNAAVPMQMNIEKKEDATEGPSTAEEEEISNDSLFSRLASINSDPPNNSASSNPLDSNLDVKLPRKVLERATAAKFNSQTASSSRASLPRPPSNVFTKPMAKPSKSKLPKKKSPPNAQLPANKTLTQFWARAALHNTGCTPGEIVTIDD